MKENPPVDPLSKLGEMLIRSLRDKSIEQHDMLLTGKLRGKQVQDLQGASWLYRQNSEL